MQNIKDKLIITIEGPIGVGKSTSSEILRRNWDDCEIVPEPVDLWKDLKNSDGKNMLDTFYTDIKRYAYTFQNVACITRMMKMEQTLKETNKKFIFLDRSLATDKNVFEKMLYDSGMINELEHQAYNLWCDFYWKYVREQTTNNTIHIYLKCDAEICHSRIQKRGRVEEKGISLEYLQDLNKYHDVWLNSGAENAIVLDCNDDFENDIEKQNQMINKIKERIEQILSSEQNEQTEKNITQHIEIVKENDVEIETN